MKVNLSEKKVFVAGKEYGFDFVVNKLHKLSGQQVGDFFANRDVKLPRAFRMEAIRSVLNEKVKESKKVSLSDEQRYRLLNYPIFSEYQLEVYFNLLETETLADDYKTDLWKIIINSYRELQLTDSEINYLLLLSPKDEESFAEYQKSLFLGTIDSKGEFDGLSRETFKVALRKAATLKELGLLGKKYGFSVPKRLRKKELLDVIFHELQKRGELNDDVKKLLKKKSTVLVSRYAKQHKIAASTELSKTDVIEYILRKLMSKKEFRTAYPTPSPSLLPEMMNFEFNPADVSNIDDKFGTHYYDEEVVDDSDEGYFPFESEFDDLEEEKTEEIPEPTIEETVVEKEVPIKQAEPQYQGTNNNQAFYNGTPFQNNGQNNENSQKVVPLVIPIPVPIHDSKGVAPADEAPKESEQTETTKVVNNEPRIIYVQNSNKTTDQDISNIPTERVILVEREKQIVSHISASEVVAANETVAGSPEIVGETVNAKNPTVVNKEGSIIVDGPITLAGPIQVEGTLKVEDDGRIGSVRTKKKIIEWEETVDEEEEIDSDFIDEDFIEEPEEESFADAEPDEENPIDIDETPQSLPEQTEFVPVVEEKEEVEPEDEVEFVPEVEPEVYSEENLNKDEALLLSQLKAERAELLRQNQELSLNYHSLSSELTSLKSENEILSDQIDQQQEELMSDQERFEVYKGQMRKKYEEERKLQIEAEQETIRKEQAANDERLQREAEQEERLKAESINKDISDVFDEVELDKNESSEKEIKSNEENPLDENKNVNDDSLGLNEDDSSKFNEVENSFFVDKAESNDSENDKSKENVVESFNLDETVNKVPNDFKESEISFFSTNELANLNKVVKKEVFTTEHPEQFNDNLNYAPEIGDINPMFNETLAGAYSEKIVPIFESEYKTSPYEPHIRFPKGVIPDPIENDMDTEDNELDTNNDIYFGNTNYCEIPTNDEVQQSNVVALPIPNNDNNNLDIHNQSSLDEDKLATLISEENKSKEESLNSSKLNEEDLKEECEDLYNFVLNSENESQFIERKMIAKSIGFSKKQLHGLSKKHKEIIENDKKIAEKEAKREEAKLLREDKIDQLIDVFLKNQKNIKPDGSRRKTRVQKVLAFIHGFIVVASILFITSIVVGILNDYFQWFDYNQMPLGLQWLSFMESKDNFIFVNIKNFIKYLVEEWNKII